MRRRVSTALVTVMAISVPLQSMGESQKSVLRVNCLLGQGKGEMKATGFIWPEKGQMVTALHAVAGCKQIEVYSQHTKKSTVADLVAVYLEADLALLTLEDDLGLEAVEHAEEAPDLGEDFMTWGFPLVQRAIKGDEIAFSRTLDGEIYSMGKTFKSDELKVLFRSQDYPNRNTKIFQVNSTIQPGHSGAPIFDEQGRVVAIADGGLLGGFVGMNWSIPAHLYLPDLPTSDDPFPGETSTWAGLFSATTPSASSYQQSAAVFSGEPLAGDGSASQIEDLPPDLEEPDYWGDPILAFGDDGPELLRQVTLREALDYARERGTTPELVEEIEAILPDDALRDEIWFNVYIDPMTGATMALPDWLDAQWIEDGGFIWASTPDGVISATLHTILNENFDGAVESLYSYVDWVDQWIDWDGARPAEFQFDTYVQYDEPNAPHHADHSGAYFGMDHQAERYGQLQLNVAASENIFLGSTLTLLPETDQPSDDEIVGALVTLLGLKELTQVFPDWDWPWQWDDRFDGDMADEWAPIHDVGEESSLQLVRQMSLRQAMEYISYRDETDPILEDIEALLWDDALKDELWYLVYEDQMTGATVAVPSWIDMSWDEEHGLLFAVNQQQTIEMSISVQAAESFEDAMHAELEYVDMLDGVASEWDDGGPGSVEGAEHFSPEDEFSSHAQMHTGRIYDGNTVTILIASRTISRNVFLGTSVQLLYGTAEWTAEDELEQILTQVSALYLTDFARL